MAEAFPVILFYRYVDIADPPAFAATQRELCAELELKGRVLIATEGINGTIAGSRGAVERYMEALRQDARFSDITFKLSAGDVGTFPKLVVKVRREIVTLNAGDLPPDRDNHLSPAAWKERMETDPTQWSWMCVTAMNPMQAGSRMPLFARSNISGSCPALSIGSSR
jgi:UPF0176 protein